MFRKKKRSLFKLIVIVGVILAAGAAVVALVEYIKAKKTEQDTIEEQIAKEIEQEIEKALADVAVEE